MSNVFPSLRGVFGTWVYYPVLFSPKQVFELIKTSKDIRESKNLDDYLQRELTSNVSKITKYIENEEDRFFNSIIVGVFEGVPDWLALDITGIDDLDHEQKKEIDESIGILKFNGSEELFAIDGQHRVEAIKLRYKDEPDYKDQIPVIFVAHSDTKLGKKRTRRLFSDLNKTAQKVSPGELAIIDEQDIENIVARKLYSEFERLPKKSVSLSKSAPIKSDESEYFTNLLTIVKVTKTISKLFFNKKKIKYTEKDIQITYNEVVNFFSLLFDNVENLEASLGNISLTRELRIEKQVSIMRPIGLEILSDVYVQCYRKDSKKSFVDVINCIDLSLSSVYFNNIIFQNKKITPKYKSLTTQLILFKVGILPKEKISIDKHFMTDELNDLINS